MKLKPVSITRVPMESRIKSRGSIELMVAAGVINTPSLLVTDTSSRNVMRAVGCVGRLIRMRLG